MALIPQRLDQMQRIFYGNEGVTEGVDPTAPTLGTVTEFFLAENLKMTPSRTHLPRRFKGAMGYFTGKIGEEGDPGLSFDCELRNRGATNNVCDIDVLLMTVFGARLPAAAGAADSGSTTCTASTSTTSFSLADRTGFAAGQGIMVENPKASGKYEASVIDTTGAGAGVVTLKQALTFQPDATGANVKSMVTYYSVDTGHPSLAFQVWLDADTYVSFVGCKGSAKISVPAAGMIPKISFNFRANAWSINSSVGNRPAVGVGDTGGPPVALATLFKRIGTKTDIMAYELDLGSKVSRKKSQNATYGTFSQIVVDRTPSGTITFYNTDDVQWTTWAAETEVGLCHQVSSSATNLNKTVMVCTPKAQIQGLAYGSDGGKTTDQINFLPDITSGSDDIFLALG